MYDLDNDGIIGPNDMKIFTNSLMRGLAYYDEKPDPTAAQVTAKVASLMMKYDCKDKDGKLSLDEFMQMLKKDPEVTELLYEYGFITKAVKYIFQNIRNNHQRKLITMILTQIQRQRWKEGRFNEMKESKESRAVSNTMSPLVMIMSLDQKIRKLKFLVFGYQK